MHLFSGKATAIIQSSGKKGQIHVKATASGIKPGIISVDTK
jgi:hypothetical protein